jgi:glycosyltransferase involved in cell wall biosynthesis
MSAPRVSVVIPARDAEKTLTAALNALAGEAIDGGHEVIVVDNGSLDRTAELAAASGVVSSVLRRARGDGPGAARNEGAAAARGSVLAFLDADCRPATGWLAAWVAATAEADLVQGPVIPEPSADRGPFDRTLSVGIAHGLFESANLFVRRELFERVQGFPPGIEAGGDAPFGEDVIFGWRASRAGARTAFCDAAIAYHVVDRRTAGQFIAERRRDALFAALAVSVPELRDAFFYRRYFLSRRSASFDLALAGMLLALLTRRRWPLAGALPYARLLAAAARWGPRRAVEVALTEAIADAVGAAALAGGSLRHRSLLA